MIRLNLKKRLTMRGYQETIVSDIIANFNIGKPYVLGSCPSSGKTEMAIEAMIRLIESGEVNRVLILAHSTNVLKENFYNRLIEYFNLEDIEVMRGQKNYNYDCAIQVMIPQNINHVIGNFDLIITDEAQHNVLAEGGNYARIVSMVNPKFQLLLTGTPSKFVKENALSDDEPYHINTVGMDMIGFEHFHDVRFDLIKSSYRFTNDDFNQNQDLFTDVVLSYADTETTINNVIVGAVRNVALRNGVVLPTNSDFVAEGRKLVREGKFGKTLIMCRNIEQANQTASIISTLFKVNVRVSQSANDTESKELERFKAGKFEFLCVVKRAREGYDDNKVVNLIDITMTHNIDLIYQMFCRVVRLDKTNPNPKLYMKVTSNAEGMPEYTLAIMTAALMLGNTTNLARFNGSNFRDIEMPRIERITRDNEDDEVDVSGGIDIVDGNSNVIRRRNINELMVLDLVQMFLTDEEVLIHGNERYAMTTLGDAMTILSGEEPFYMDKQGYFELIRNEEISTSTSWNGTCSYRELSKRDGVRYHSAPWSLFNQKEKEFFAECYPDNIMCTDKEVYFELIRNEGITGKHIWRDRYKELSERYGLRYHSAPWTLFNQSSKDFFDECYPNNIMCTDKEVYFELIRNEGSVNGWSNIYKELSERYGLRYHSAPWTLFNQSSKDFFDECYPNRQEYYDNKEGYFELIRNEGITNSRYWRDRYKELSERNGLKYHSKPWRFLNQSEKEFFAECYKDFEKPKNGKYRSVSLGEFSKMNKTWNTTNSDTTYKRLTTNPAEWREYHVLYGKLREKWSEIPYIEIGKKLKERPEWIVGDFGCGENLLKTVITNKIHAFDFIAIDDTVTSCDLSCVPLNNEVLDVVVFSLALMGTNYSESLLEAHRVLKKYGVVMIAEPRNRWSDDLGDLDEERVKTLMSETGFRITGDIKVTDSFIYIDAIKY